MPDVIAMFKLIVPMVLLAIWVMSLITGKDQQQQQGQRPGQRPTPPRVPPGGMAPSRPGDGAPLVIVRNPRTGQEILVGGEYPPAWSRRPEPPPRPRDPDSRRPARPRPPEKGPAPVVPNKVAVPSLIRGGTGSASQPSAPPAPSRSARPAPAAGLAASLRSPERIREAFILSEILKPPLALRRPRS